MLAPIDARNAASLPTAAAATALEAKAAGVAKERPAAKLRSKAVPTLVPAARAGPLATAQRPSAAKSGEASRAPVPGYASSKAATAEAKSSSTKSSSTKSSSTKSSSGSASGDLAFLKDKNLPIEEKLVRLLGYLNNKWEKEMQQKLDAIAAGEAGAKKASSGSKKGGLLGSIPGVGDAVKSIFGPVSAALKMPVVRDLVDKVGGPVLAAAATALGFPQLAPLALKYGPGLVKSAADLLASVEGGSTGGARGSSGSSSGGAKALSDADRQTLMLEIQRLQQKQQEMLGLVSNILKTNHDARLSVVNNIR